MSPDEILNRLLYLLTALALVGAFATSESFLSQLALVGDAISKAMF